MQKTFADAEYERKSKTTRKDRFLAEIERVTPWNELIAVVDPHYPKVVGRGRRPIGVQRMLRMYVVQQCFGLSDEGIEDAIYDSQAIRRFVGIDLVTESSPDATTLLKFRHLLQEHDLTEKIFEAINKHLQERGLMLRQGTVVDATIIAAPSSTKNDKGERDPEMHQTKKGNQWHFGMKAHIGVDAASGLTHTLVTTAANVSDVSQAAQLLHGEEQVVYADAGYQGIEKREETQGLKDRVKFEIAMRPSKREKLEKLWGLPLQAIEHAKASIRAKVEHPFHWVKNIFGHKKTRYRGLKKNTAQLYTLFGMANLMIASRLETALKMRFEASQIQPAVDSYAQVTP